MRARIVRSRIARSAGAALAATALIALLAPPAPALEARGGGSVAAVGDVARIRMRDNLFRPASITVQRGTRVRWVNRGENPHTTTSARGIWDSGVLQPGESFARRFRRAGTFRYFCSIHAGMTGRVIVEA